MKKLMLVLSLLSVVCQSYAQILSISSVPAIRIAFAGVPAGVYQLQSSTNPANAEAWQDVATITGDGTNFSYSTLVGAGPTIVYRTKLVATPPTIALISLDSISPEYGVVPVSDVGQGQYLGLPALVFDLGAQGDGLRLHQLTANVNAAGQGVVNAAYLYSGSTLVSSAAVVNGLAVFQNILDGTAGASVPVNSSLPLTIKVDVSGLVGQSSYEDIQVVVHATNVVVVNSAGTPVTTIGDATGNILQVVSKGPVFSLTGQPTISKVNITAGGSTNSTFQYVATFNVNVTAVGESVTLGLPNSDWPTFGNQNTITNVVQVYVNGTPAATPPIVVAAYAQPSNTVLAPDGKAFTVAQNQTVTVPVTYSWIVVSPQADTYSIQLKTIRFLDAHGSGIYMVPGAGWITSPL